MNATAKQPRAIGRAGRITEAGRAALDVLLTEAAVGTGDAIALRQAGGRRQGRGRVGARHPRRAERRAAGLGGELARVAAGRSEVAAAKGDRRFSEPAWEGNGLLRRVLQGYLASARRRRADLRLGSRLANRAPGALRSGEHPGRARRPAA